MTRICRTLHVVLALAAFVPASRAAAQGARPWGRVSFMADGVRASDNGSALPGFTEIVGSFTFTSPYRDKGGTEYKIDFRSAGYPSSEDRATRVSLYDAYIGHRFSGGAFNVRAGQMWLNELGGLGSVGGFLAEYRLSKAAGFRQIRFGAFGGVEPQILDAGYVNDVRKGGAYVAFEREGAWRDVVGIVIVRDGGLTERSVITTTNFLPLTKTVMVYQAAEIDLTGPGGHGSGGLTYFFANANWRPTPRFDFQATFHRGRSIDSRSITLDLLNGRPVSASALEGFLYESVGGRATVTVAQNIRVFGGYARERGNRSDMSTDRITFGAFTPNILGTGFDVRISDDRFYRSTSDFDGWNVSIGRTVVGRVYLSAEYSTSLSVVQVTTLGGFVVQNQPRTRRYAIMSNVNLNRWIYLLLTAEQLRDGTIKEFRWISGITYRF